MCYDLNQHQPDCTFSYLSGTVLNMRRPPIALFHVAVAKAFAVPHAPSDHSFIGDPVSCLGFEVKAAPQRSIVGLDS